MKTVETCINSMQNVESKTSFMLLLFSNPISEYNFGREVTFSIQVAIIATSNNLTLVNPNRI